MGVIAGTLFIRTHIHDKTFTDANLIAGFLFFTMIQLYFGGIAEITFTIDRLPVFYRQVCAGMACAGVFWFQRLSLRLRVHSTIDGTADI